MVTYLVTEKRLARGSKLYQVRMGYESGPVVFTTTNWVHAHRERDRLAAQAEQQTATSADTGSKP